MESVSVIDVSNVRDQRPGRINQYIGAFLASLGGFSLGVSLAWNSSANDTMRNFMTASNTEIGLAGGILNAGACCGSLLLPVILRFVSPTGTMFASLPVSILGWAFICFADQRVWVLIIGRLICGLVCGIFSVIIPLFIAEIADKNIRPRLLTCFQLFVNCGTMYAFLVAYVINEHNAIWRYSLTCAVACAPIALINCLPESPLYHVAKGNKNAAKNSIKWYRGQKYEYHNEFRQFEKLAEIKKLKINDTIKMLKNRKILWRLVVCHGIMVAQQFSGVNTMIFYALTLFNYGGSGNITGGQQTLVLGAVGILSCFLCTFAIDRLGRRILLTLSSGFMGLFLILLGWYLKVRDDDPELYEETYGWMPPTWISLFFVAFNLGVGPISWAMLADTFPMEIRVAGASSTAFLSWFISLVAPLTLSEMVTALGISSTMWIFATFSFLFSGFFAAFVWDNNGKSLLDIQTDFGTGIIRVE